MGSSNCLLLSMFLVLIEENSVKCIDFGRNYTGVYFSPYVKRSENGSEIPHFSYYTFVELKTMLEVMSTKFSRIETGTVDAIFLELRYPNNKRFEYSYIISRTAETAAQINQERGNKSLTMYIGIWDFDYLNDQGNRTDLEVHIAVGAVQRANAMFPGTLVFRNLYNPSWGKLTLQWLKNIRKMMSNLNVDVKLGIAQYYNFLEMLNKNESDEASHWKDIMSMTDFIVCLYRVKPNLASESVQVAFEDVSQALLSFRAEMSQINSNIAIMGETNWASAGNETWKNINNLKEYWSQMNQFALNNKYPIWLKEAFDNPIRGTADSALGPHIGWWKLTKNALAANPSGYVEKNAFTEKEEEMERSRSLLNLETKNEIEKDEPGISQNILIWASVGVFVLLGNVAGGISLFLRMRKRIRSLKRRLTESDIQEFKYGKVQDMELEELDDGKHVCWPALRTGYDTSLEIPKEMLEIAWDKILGVGQFGCVHRATIKNRAGEVVEAALKKPKSDCPVVALKGLLSEIKILSYWGRHPNITYIVGAYTAEMEKGIVYIATELCELGSLKKYLSTLKENVSDNCDGILPDLIQWSYEIAYGMEYLAEKEVVHADLATRNVLLSSGKVAKITDFGLSKRLYNYAEYVKSNQEPLPWKWMAIESLKSMKFSVKSDVWSYGVTLWEIFSMGDVPFPGVSWNLDFVGELESGLRMQKPSYATDEMYEVMIDCWQSQPKNRPTFTELKTFTKDLRNKDYYLILNDI